MVPNWDGGYSGFDRNWHELWFPGHPTKMRTKWSILPFEGYQGLNQLEGDWRRLVAEMPDHGPQHHFEIYQAYVRHLSMAKERFLCLALSDGTHIRAILPLELDSFSIFGRRFAALGLPWQMFDLNRDLICPPDEAQTALLPAVLRWIRCAPGRQTWWLVLDQILEGSAASRCIDFLPASNVCWDEFGASAMFGCDTTYTEFESRLSRKFRANLRSARRRLATLDDVRFVNVTDPASVKREFGVFLEVEASGWKGTNGSHSAVRLRSEQLAYYQAIVNTSSTGTGCEFNAIYAGQECIASALCFRGGSEYAVPKIGFDERYSHASPGQLLLEWILELCMNDPQVRRLNMVSNAEWLLPWKPVSVQKHRVIVGVGLWTGPVLTWFFRLGVIWVPRIKAYLSQSPFGSRILQWLMRK